MTTEEIRTILSDCKAMLERIDTSVEFQALQASEGFSTPNDLVLADAILALYEVRDAIAVVEKSSIDAEQCI
jgi:hypothetical protein